jgi:hypothetical protein
VHNAWDLSECREVLGDMVVREEDLNIGREREDLILNLKISTTRISYFSGKNHLFLLILILVHWCYVSFRPGVQ